MRNERSVRIDISAFAILLLSAFSLSAASLSSLSCNDRLDNNCNPAPVVCTNEDREFALQIDADWFGESEALLYTNGVLAASSTGGAQELILQGASDTYRSYILTLKAGDREFTKVVTIFPSADYSCSLHSLARDRQFLDSHPAGTLRRLKAYNPMDISWSGLWSENGDRAEVKLYKGADGEGGLVAELVSVDTPEEGTLEFLPSASSITTGIYTFRHFDGVETLSASFSFTDRSLWLILR